MCVLSWSQRHQIQFNGMYFLPIELYVCSADVNLVHIITEEKSFEVHSPA